MNKNDSILPERLDMEESDLNRSQLIAEETDGIPVIIIDRLIVESDTTKEDKNNEQVNIAIEDTEIDENDDLTETSDTQAVIDQLDVASETRPRR